LPCVTHSAAVTVGLLVLMLGTWMCELWPLVTPANPIVGLYSQVTITVLAV
jgi:uncharacterized membrane protein